jgi:uncharacterized damage-inducible protein DinB
MRRLRDAGAGVALVALAGLLLAGDAGARQPASSVFSEVTRSAWYNVNSVVLAAARKMPPEHYAFRPVKDTRTFAELVGHLVAEHYAVCGAVTGRPAPPTAFEKLMAKDALVSALEDSIALCDLAYGLLTDENAAFRYTIFNTSATRLSLLTDTIAHDNEHYGNMATYMRIKGVTPPGGGQ